MPRMLVITESLDRSDREVMLDEHVATSDLDSDHFAAQLVERIGWALGDAETAERRPRVPAMRSCADAGGVRSARAVPARALDQPPGGA